MRTSTAGLLVLFAAGGATAQQAWIETMPRLESRAGNSVDTATGAFLVEQKVFELQGGRDLPFIIYHDSRAGSASGDLGLGWWHNYSAELRIQPNSQAHIYWSPSSYNRYRRVLTGNGYSHLDFAAANDTLTRNTNGSHVLLRHDGTVYEFDPKGRLTGVANKLRQFIIISRDANGLITEISEPMANRVVTVAYDRSSAQARISTLTLPGGRVVLFEYAGNRLDAIRNPAAPGQAFGEPFVPKTIPDANPSGVVHPINVTQNGFAGLVRVDLGNISHARRGDLRVYLIAPSGRRVEIPKPQGTGPSLVFDGMVVGGFEGEPVQGMWQLQVADTVSGTTGVLNGWRMSFSGSAYPTYLSYDFAGRVNGAADAALRLLFVNAYDSFSRVIEQDDGVNTNQTARFSYSQDGPNLVTRYTDRMGAVSEYVHSPALDLLEFTDPLQQTTRFEYDNESNRTAVIDALGRTTRFAYTNGNLTGVIDPASAITVAEYDSRRNLTRITDALGRSASFEYNNRNNLTAVADALGNRTVRPYNGSGQMIGIIKPGGVMVDFNYAQGMMTSANHPAGGTLRQAYANGNATRHSYDLRNRRSQTISPSGAITSYAYDGNDNLISVTDPLGRVTRFH